MFMKILARSSWTQKTPISGTNKSQPHGACVTTSIQCRCMSNHFVCNLSPKYMFPVLVHALYKIRKTEWRFEDSSLSVHTSLAAANTQSFTSHSRSRAFLNSFFQFAFRARIITIYFHLLACPTRIAQDLVHEATISLWTGLPKTLCRATRMSWRSVLLEKGKRFSRNRTGSQKVGSKWSIPHRNDVLKTLPYLYTTL
jgi:hypothetical protein